MNNSISNLYNGFKWGEILQNIDQRNLINENNDQTSPIDKMHGILAISEDTFNVEIIHPDKETTLLTLNLNDIISISKEILKKSYPQEKQEISKGLKHLETELQHILISNTNQAAMKQFYKELESLKKSSELTPEELIKLKLQDIGNHAVLVEGEIQTVRELIKTNKNLLFNFSEYRESFFDLVKDKNLKEILLPLLIDVIKDIDTLEKENTEKLKSFLFHRYSGGSFFEILMRKEEGNVLFDKLLKTLTNEEINASINKFRRDQILDFGYSTTRYEYIFFKVENISNKVVVLADQCSKTLQIHYVDSIRDTYSKKSKYEKWLSLRRGSSSTLTLGGDKLVEANLRWNEAEKLRSRYVKEHRTQNIEDFKWNLLQNLHFVLCNGEVGIIHPGERRKPGEIVRTGGGWTHTYCLPENLLDNLKVFMPWFKNGLKQCEKGELSPIIFAAQTYQRLVSYHCFENGNGRFSRLVMDYVLERFFLPPPVLGEDILDALFPLDPLKEYQEDFITKIIAGIEASKKILES